MELVESWVDSVMMYFQEFPDAAYLPAEVQEAHERARGKGVRKFRKDALSAATVVPSIVPEKVAKHLAPVLVSVDSDGMLVAPNLDLETAVLNRKATKEMISQISSGVLNAPPEVQEWLAAVGEHAERHTGGIAKSVSRVIVAETAQQQAAAAVSANAAEVVAVAAEGTAAPAPAPAKAVPVQVTAAAEASTSLRK